MRVIELKLTTLSTLWKLTDIPVSKDVEFDPDTMKKITFSYRDTIKNVLQIPSDPKEGLKIAEIRNLIKIIDELETLNDGDNLILEDDLYSVLKTRIDNNSWGYAHKVIVEFVDDIDHAKAVSKEKLQEAAKEIEVFSDSGKKVKK